MTISFACPNCKSIWNVPDAVAGRTTQCRTCGSALLVPSPVVEESVDLPLESSPEAKRDRSTTEDVKQPQPPKPSVLALVGGGISAAVGIGVGRYAGFALLIPAGFALLAGWIL